MKRLINQLLRRMKLEGLIYYYWFFRSLLYTSKSNRDFILENPTVRLPSNLARFDVSGTTCMRRYYLEGLSTAKMIDLVVREHFPMGCVRVYEWGCGPGRVLSRLPEIDADRRYELIGSDYLTKPIHWASGAFPNIRFLCNHLSPPVAIADQSVDFAYAISVFTHLTEASHRAWLAEILRVLRPGGVFLFTTHGDSFRHEIASPEDQVRYDAGELVMLRASKDGSQMSCAFHSAGFMHRFLSGLDIVAHRPQGLDQQDVWIVRRREKPGEKSEPSATGESPRTVPAARLAQGSEVTRTRWPISLQHHPF